MAAEIHLAVPGRLDQATGGYRYMARMVAELRRAGHAVRVHELAGRAPIPDDAARASAVAAVAALGPGDRLVVDGLCLPAFDGLLPRGRSLAVIHHPLAAETGIEPAGRVALDRLERRLLALAGRVLVTSPATARAVRAMGVPAHALDIVLPGTDPAGLPPPRRGRPRLLTVATVTPRKGHRLAAMALAGCPRRWRWRIVGSTARDPAETASLRAALSRLRLGRRTRLDGEVGETALDRAWRGASLFLLASRHEGYGMAFAEALARRLPVIGFAAGAVRDTVPARAGILVRDGDVRALRRALRDLLAGPRRRARLAAGARWAAARLPDWPRQARAFAAALGRLG